MQIPAGLTQRPLVRSDAAAVTDLIAASELADVGEVVIEEADIVGEWQRPSYDVSTTSVAVLDGDRIVAYAEVMGGDRGDAAVHPDYRGRGIGTQLAGWMQAKARALGAVEVGMPVPQGSTGDRLLESLGYRVRWTSWVLELPAGAVIPERTLPEGYAIRTATDDDYRACWTVLEDAFLEWSVRERQPYEDFAAQVIRRPGFQPWNLRVATDPDGAVAGVAVITLANACGFVDRLATRKEDRGRGIAQALLVDSFAQATSHGATKSELSTDSRTGALGLYEKVGMVTTSVWVNRGITV